MIRALELTPAEFAELQRIYARRRELAERLQQMERLLVRNDLPAGFYWLEVQHELALLEDQERAIVAVEAVRSRAHLDAALAKLQSWPSMAQAYQNAQGQQTELERMARAFGCAQCLPGSLDHTFRCPCACHPGNQVAP